MSNSTNSTIASLTEAKAASADSLFCPEIFCADRQSVVDGFHSRRRPRGNLNSMPFIPIFHKAFQKNLVAVLNRDAYSLYFSFKTQPQRVFNLLLHVHCLHTRFDINRGARKIAPLPEFVRV